MMSTQQLHITMITVENFYWILFDNLLKPSGLDCAYYYPWGTKDNLSRFEFKNFVQLRDQSHVLFHFDQEPLWSDHFGVYDNDPPSWSRKFCRILANSEKSDSKKDICISRGFLDWYFFYHGFAALDWYRDAQFIRHQHPINNVFLSFNHVMSRRAYRMALTARLLAKSIAHAGSISFHATTQDIATEIRNPRSQLSATSRALVRNQIADLDLPWKLDDVPISGDLSARFGHNEYRLWQNSLWHIVNETVFYEPKLHLTEKVFKPIVAQRPFMLVAAPYNLRYLRGYGFETFGNWIDESYDSMQDPDQRLDAIVKEIGRFASMSLAELRHVHQEMMPVLEFNKQHFFGKFREIIVNELVDNFDQCIRLWNNGRVDGRELVLHPDLEQVKRTLLL